MDTQRSDKKQRVNIGRLSFARFPMMLGLKGTEGPFTQSSAENERRYHASPYLFIHGGDGGG